MSFASLQFGLFFALVLGGYVCLGRRAQNRLLLVASYVFYGAWDWRFLFLLLFSTVVDFIVGSLLAASDDPRRRRLLVTASLATNLGILGFFKYAGFFAESFASLAAQFGFEASEFVLDIVLPAGISFYTFQTLSYTIDIYRGRLEPVKSFFDFALFVAFFPQLVAGPIERASRLLPQIENKRFIGWEQLNSGAWLILWGLYKKVVISDNLAVAVDAVYGNGATPTSAEIIVATYAFAWQIYCDFSGYTDIARGTARMLGFNLMLNFNIPYAATNPAEFWRRWHISLSTWLRDYLYVPMGGNRRGTWFTYRNLFLTMTIGGLWHGAAWPFVLWGAYHGALLMGHRALFGKDAHSEGTVSTWRSCAASIAMFHLAAIGWMFFRANSLGHIAGLLDILTGTFAIGMAAQWIAPMCFLLAPLFAMQFAQWRSDDLEVIARWPVAARVATYSFLVLGILTLGEQIGQPFIYFQF